MLLFQGISAWWLQDATVQTSAGCYNGLGMAAPLIYGDRGMCKGHDYTGTGA